MMKLTHNFAELTPDNRPQDPHMDGTGLRFETHAARWGICFAASAITAPDSLAR
jgi:hypothetical protein